MPIFEYIDILSTPYEIFLFDTDRDSMLPTRVHWHYYAEILYVYQGAITVEYDGHTQTLSKGHMILIYPRVIHSIYAASDEKICFGVVKFSFDNFYQSDSFPQELRAVFSEKNSLIRFLSAFSRKRLQGSTSKRL